MAPGEECGAAEVRRPGSATVWTFDMGPPLKRRLP